MRQYPGGWLDFVNMEPVSIAQYISFAVLAGGAFNGVIQQVTTFNTPTGGSWQVSPLAITQEPVVQAINYTYSQSDVMLANAMNMQTQMYNPNAPIPMQNMLFLYGNANELRFSNIISLDFGMSSYNLCQISVTENSATLGDAHGLIEVIDFGAGAFSGGLTLELTLGAIFGPVNIGIRLESTTGDSSIFNMKTMILNSY